mmetsp:Transcript_8179/g.26944  ORF Transcript_8179/g.26944 Transcript_8179/m.26944 type:complete len:236 (+) Transcript_8179:441-1148(+)
MPIAARISHAKNSHSSQKEGGAGPAPPDFLYIFLLLLMLFFLLFLEDDDEDDDNDGDLARTLINSMNDNKATSIEISVKSRRLKLASINARLRKNANFDTTCFMKKDFEFARSNQRIRTAAETPLDVRIIVSISSGKGALCSLHSCSTFDVGIEPSVEEEADIERALLLLSASFSFSSLSSLFPLLPPLLPPLPPLLLLSLPLLLSPPPLPLSATGSKPDFFSLTLPPLSSASEK